jgi:UDP-N-acetylmuramoyl-tripeptide--D-alanyl-D-alanine ligase
MILLSDLYQLFLMNPVVSTDTRGITEGCMFFALKGPNFNGNRFAVQALEKGAAFAVIDEAEFKTDERMILVDDVLKILQDLARYHRLHLNPVVIAITGSNGKTTTKELLNAVLSPHFETLATTGNLNNHIGVPLTLLKLKPEHTHAIIEMGANKVGDIAELVEIARPSYGIITNIGKAHLEGFRGETGVARGKSEMYYFLFKTGGIAFVNVHEEKTVSLSPRLKTVYIGCRSLPAFVSGNFNDALLVKDNPSIHFELGNKNYSSSLSGIYNFQNILMAIGVGKYFGIDPEQIGQSISEYIPQNMRHQWVEKNGNRILLDAYNANPDSMRKALENFSRLEASNKIVILGDMFELGNDSAAEHQAIADHIHALDIEEALIAGNYFAETRTSSNTKKFKTFDELREYFDQQRYSGKTILIKGSRGMMMERLVKSE